MQRSDVSSTVRSGRDLTILLATYEGETFLSPLLASLDNQAHRPSLVVVRDDGSKDDSVQLVRQWAASSDLNVRIVEDGERLGACQSFLRLLKEVETPFFAFCDQDDLWHRDRLSRGVAALEHQAEEVAAWCSDADMVDASGRPLGETALRHRFGSGPLPAAFPSLLLMNVAIGATMTGTKALAEAVVDLTKGERQPFMHDWLCALLAANSGRLIVDPRPAIDYRRHENAETGQPRGWRQRLDHLVASGSAQRTAKVQRAAKNAEPLLEAEFLTSSNRQALERLAAVGAKQNVTRRDLRRLASVGVRATPRLRQLAWYR